MCPLALLPDGRALPASGGRHLVAPRRPPNAYGQAVCLDCAIRARAPMPEGSAGPTHGPSDVMGNLWQWTATSRGGDCELCGGAWHTHAVALKSRVFRRAATTFPTNAPGFRVVGYDGASAAGRARRRGHASPGMAAGPPSWQNCARPGASWGRGDRCLGRGPSVSPLRRRGRKACERKDGQEATSRARVSGQSDHVGPAEAKGVDRFPCRVRWRRAPPGRSASEGHVATESLRAGRCTTRRHLPSLRNFQANKELSISARPVSSPAWLNAGLFRSSVV